MDILAANDQENLVHNLQAGAAAKPLNAGLKGFNAKTPGNKAPKTPFKVPLNDENAQARAGKSVLKASGKQNENLLMASKKGGKVDASAFVTPAGPRTRAPLGMKTTNAKAKAFQTPAPLSTSAKAQKISPRLRRPKVKVLQQELPDDDDDDVPEVEYMAPKEIPLPDMIEEYAAELNFNMFKGEAMTRGVWDVYHNPVEDDGRTRGEREIEESLEIGRKQRDEEFDKLFGDTMAKEDAEIRRHFGVESPKKAAPKTEIAKKHVLAPSTLKAKSAAAALASPPKPSYAAQTASAKSRGILPVKKATKPAINPSTSRHAAATAASKSTIGYAQGRPTSTTTRKPLSNVTRPPVVASTFAQPTTVSLLHSRTESTAFRSAKPRGTFSRSSSTSTNATLVAPTQEDQTYQTAENIEHEMRLMALHNDDDSDVDAWMDSFKSQLGADPFEDEYDEFQLQLPGGL
ncbi:hypothetical protein CC78DRAFT_532341 [Lojkania enalia]|uniref:Uncharacterized protein n=1 Tax=Lojkania enalia TaxID=147567 RepID=A0A9P4N553_9PLEO|nr:hypothetical protein CC78DRAFT_532341 [Didymosphaeria enalia]